MRQASRPGAARAETDGEAHGTAHGKAHNLALDSVRGIAALSIVIHHIVISSTFARCLGLDGPVSSFFSDCWILVDLFFVLSGIVMAMNYGRPAGAFSIKGFMARRLARIYPLHLAMLLVLLPLRGARLASAAAGLPVVSGLTSDVNTPFAFLMHLLLLNALGTLDSLNWNGPSWSISAEFYTYLIFAGLVALLAAKRCLALTAPVFALVSVAALAVALLVLGKGSLEFHYDFGIVRCLYSFALGVVTFKVVEAFRGGLAPRVGGRGQVVLGLAAAALVAGVGANPGLSFLAPPLFALLLGSLLLDGGTLPARLLALPPLVWLGQRSYSVYMVHSTVIVLAEYAFRAVGLDRIRALDGALHGSLALVLTAGIVALVLLLSDFTLKFIERPGSRLVLSLFDRPRYRAPVPVLDLREHR